MKFYFLNNYDSRRPGHSYAMYTTGSDWCVQDDEGRETFIAYRSYDCDYLTEVKEIPPREAWVEKPLEAVPGLVLKRVGILRPKWAKAIEEELANVKNNSSSKEVEVLTFTQAWLKLEYGFDLTPAKVRISREDYCEQWVNKWPTEYPPTALFSPGVNHRYYAYGINAGHNYDGVVLLPWEQTRWGSKEAYLVYKREADEAERKAEEARKAEQAKWEAEKARRKAAEHKEFARMCGQKARMCGVPFEIALAFKGDEAAIRGFKTSLRRAIEDRLAYSEHELLECGRARKGAEMRRLGLEIGSVDPHRLSEYIGRCLEAKQVFYK